MSINHLDIYKHLDRSNCRKCGISTCMAFAVAVMHGEKKLIDCPRLDAHTADELEEKIVRREPGLETDTTIKHLKKALSDVDFKAVAEGIGAEPDGDRLRVKCLGKDFFIDKKGNVESNIHVNPWVIMPLLRYVITGGGKSLSGSWISFEELEKGMTMAQYFKKRCEDPLQKLADSHTDIFFDLLNIFCARNADDRAVSADYARIIHPLPRIPFLILYWKPEEDFGSCLRILLDSSTDSYLDAHSVYVLARGIVEMFKKILSKHEELLPAIMAL